MWSSFRNPPWSMEDLPDSKDHIHKWLLSDHTQEKFKNCVYWGYIKLLIHNAEDAVFLLICMYCQSTFAQVCVRSLDLSIKVQSNSYITFTCSLTIDKSGSGNFFRNPSWSVENHFDSKDVHKWFSSQHWIFLTKYIQIDISLFSVAQKFTKVDLVIVQEPILIHGESS